MMIKIGDLEITRFVQDATIKPLGGTTKRSFTSFPGTRRYSMRHEGIEPRGWSLSLVSVDDESGLDAVLAAFNDAVEDTKFYPYYATRFARVLLASAWEDQSYHYAQVAWAAAAEVHATIADLFDDEDDTWYPQQNEKHSITPAGTIAAPLDELKIIGNYVNGAHVESPTIKIYDAAGTALEASVLITDILLTDEELTLDYRGKITQVYSDSFTDSTKFMQDAESTGCSIESDGLNIGPDCSAVWLLSGPWPLTKNIVIETTELVTGAGKIYLQYSFDNSIWRTAISNDDLKAAKTWTIPNTAGHGDVYIRFSATSGGDDENERTYEVILSEITSAVRTRQVVGVWGKTNNAGDYMLLVKLATGVYAYQIIAASVSDDWHIGSDYEASVAMYAASVVTEHTDRTDAQILTDVTTSTSTRKGYDEGCLRGVWGRTNASYMLLVKLDNGYYAYQPMVSANGSRAWAIGTAAQAAAALYEYSDIGGDRSNDDILYGILHSTSLKNGYDTGCLRGVWGRVDGSGDYMLLVKLAEDTYAYQPMVAANGSQAWAIGTAAQAASIFYSYCAVPTTRTATQILNDVAGTTKNRDDIVRGVYGRTIGGGYVLMIKLAADTYYCWFSDGARSIASASEVASALYNSTSGTRSLADISADIANTSWPDYNDSNNYYTVYGKLANANPIAKIFQVENSPRVRAYRITNTDGSYSSWKIDTNGGISIRDALVSASPAVTSRTVSDIKASILAADFLDPSNHEYSVDGPYSGVKPTAIISQVQASPKVFAYRIAKPDGTYTSWAIDASSGLDVRSTLLDNVSTGRTEADILASINALVFYDLADYTYLVYGYVNGARPIATVTQVQASPAVYVYKISQANGTNTAWLLEAHAGADCRDALIAGFTGISSRTQEDIRADILDGDFKSPASLSWIVYGYEQDLKPYAVIILLENSPRVYAYQIDYPDSGLSTWAVDANSGQTIANILSQYSSTPTEGGIIAIRDIEITQVRRIPWRELPLLPLDGLAHCVEIVNGPDIKSAYLKATGESLGLPETFTAETATGGKIYLKADTGKYLSSPWGENYVTCIEDSPVTTCEFELIPLGTSGDGNTVGAIKCPSGQYLSASDDGAGFVLATALQIGPTELFEFIDLGSGQWAFKVTSPVATESLELDTGELDASTLDGDVDEASIYAGNYLTAVSGTLTGVNPITATYRDRYSI